MISPAVLEAITPEELTRAASVFGALKQLRLRLNPEEAESKLDQAFENHVASVLGRLDNRLPSMSENHEMRKVEVIMARHGLYDAAFQQAILLGTSISPALGDALKDIRFIHSGFMTDMQKVGTDFNTQLRQTKQLLERSKNDLEMVENECKNLVDAAEMLDKEADAHEQEILELRSKLRSATLQVEKYSLVTSAPSMMHNDGIVSPLSPFASSQRTHGQVFDTKVTPSGRLSSGGNSNLNNSKFISGGEIGNSSVHSPQRSVSSRSQQQSYVSSSSVYSSEHWLIHFRAEMQKAMDSRADAAAAAKDVGSHQNHSGQGGRSGQSGCMRMLSFNETLELIGKFYESKKLLNSKCGGNPHQQQIRNVSAAGAAVPVFETMEQHVYHSYEKKYGLRTLALEHCSMFVSALELYSSSECITRYNCPLYSSVDIRVFYKIFRNELDENFHEIHQQLNKSIRDLIVLHIMNRYPNKTQEAVQELLDKKMNGIINNEEWTDIVNYLYNGNDARSVLLQLKIAAQEEHDTTTAAVRAGSATTPPAGSPHLLKGSMTAAEREKEARRLGYARGAVGTGNDKKKLNASSYATPEKRSCLKMSVTTFLFTVFSFQLASHEMYLTKFVRVFHKHDSNGDGVVTTEEFWRCFLDIRGVTEVAAGPVEEGMFAQLLEGLDPNKTGIVTFTSAAEALSQFATASAAM